MKKSIILLVIFITSIALMGCSKQVKNDLSNNQSVKTFGTVAFDNYNININKSEPKAFTKDVLIIVKHSIDSDLPVNDVNLKVLDEYISKYHGNDFYSSDFKNKYSDRERIVFEDAWLAIISNKQYFSSKTNKEEGYEKTMENCKKTIANICNEYLK